MKAYTQVILSCLIFYTKSWELSVTSVKIYSHTFTGDLLDTWHVCVCVCVFWCQEDIRLAFLNISRIMDCVGCFKCRLWGKLQASTHLPHTLSGSLVTLWFIALFSSRSGQTQGLGTSLKILFSGRQIEALPPSGVQRPAFQLSRQEIVSLFNAFGRWLRPSETCLSTLEHTSRFWNKSFVKVPLFPWEHWHSWEKMSFPWISTGFPPASESCRTSESCSQRNSEDEDEVLLWRLITSCLLP